MVLHDILHSISRQVTNLLHPRLQNLPHLQCCLGRSALVLGNILDLLVSLLNNLINFLAVLAVDGVEVVESSVNVAFRAGNESCVGEGGGSEPLDCFVRLWGGFGELLGCLEIVLDTEI